MEFVFWLNTIRIIIILTNHLILSIGNWNPSTIGRGQVHLWTLWPSVSPEEQVHAPPRQTQRRLQTRLHELRQDDPQIKLWSPPKEVLSWSQKRNRSGTRPPRHHRPRRSRGRRFGRARGDVRDAGLSSGHENKARSIRRSYIAKVGLNALFVPIVSRMGSHVLRVRVSRMLNLKPQFCPGTTLGQMNFCDS